jgi:hypothetical protein
LARVAIWAVTALHSWVLTVFREHYLQESWSAFFHEGVQLPWFRVLRMTSAPGSTLLSGSIIPAGILAATGLAVWIIWRQGKKMEINSAPSTNVAPAAS